MGTKVMSIMFLFCVACVLVQSPLSLVLLPPLQPVYETSSHTISYFAQFSPVDVMSQYTVSCSTPPNSTQAIPRYIGGNATRSILAQGSISLNVLSLLDCGIYTCSVRLISSNPYVIASDYTNGSTEIQITSKK